MIKSIYEYDHLDQIFLKYFPDTVEGNKSFSVAVLMDEEFFRTMYISYSLKKCKKWTIH